MNEQMNEWILKKLVNLYVVTQLGMERLITINYAHLLSKYFLKTPNVHRFRNRELRYGKQAG